jgi:hypothetical protein
MSRPLGILPLLSVAVVHPFYVHNQCNYKTSLNNSRIGERKGKREERRKEEERREEKER